jgi:hypothetical protein
MVKWRLTIDMQGPAFPTADDARLASVSAILDPTSMLTFAPVFICGVHRSGTTWLQQIIADTGRFDYVSAYHVIRYDDLPNQPSGEFRDAPAYRELATTFHTLGVNTRELDDVEVTPDLPEEYGFILHNAGLGKKLTRKNLPTFFEICRRIRQGDDDRRIVLKNPWDAANFLFIKDAIPSARFVFIHRDPRRVIHSCLKSARMLVASRNAYGALLSREYQWLFSGSVVARACLQLHRLGLSRFLELGIRYVTAEVAAANLYFVRNVAKLPPESYISVKYEDLCDRPGEMLGRVLEFVGVDPSLASSLRTPAKPRSHDVLPEVKSFERVIKQKMTAYLAMQGYES